MTQGNINFEFQTQMMRTIAQQSPVYINVGGPIITITEDKIRLALSQHSTKLAYKYTWLAPAGILATLLAVLITAVDFRDWLLAPAVWEALFVFFTIAAAILTAILLFKHCTNRTSIDSIIDTMRANQIAVSPETDTQSWAARGHLLAQHIQAGTWYLVFNPPQRSKEIAFLHDGNIGVGRNDNEHTWRIRQARLELLDVSGRVFSRFVYQPNLNEWHCTNDPDLRCIRGQIIRRTS